MAHVVFTSQVALDSFAASVNSDRGIPADGVRAGGGIHAVRSDGRTTRYQGYLRHRTLTRWAYPDDNVVARIATPVGATRQTLDSTWNDAAQNLRPPDPEM